MADEDEWIPPDPLASDDLAVKEFNAFRWKAVQGFTSDSTLSPAAKDVAKGYIIHANSKTGLCCVSIQSLAAYLDVHEGTVKRAREELGPPRERKRGSEQVIIGRNLLRWVKPSGPRGLSFMQFNRTKIERLAEVARERQRTARNVSGGSETATTDGGSSGSETATTSIEATEPSGSETATDRSETATVVVAEPLPKYCLGTSESEYLKERNGDPASPALCIFQEDEGRTRKRRPAPDPEGFALFWRHYPTEDGMCEPDAFAEWNRLTVDERTLAVVGIPCLKEYAAKKGPTYPMQHPSNYLRKQRWTSFKAVKMPDWEATLRFCRERMMWDPKSRGPMPNTPGCRVPQHLLLSTDGIGWAIYQTGKGLDAYPVKNPSPKPENTEGPRS